MRRSRFRLAAGAGAFVLHAAALGQAPEPAAPTVQGATANVTLADVAVKIAPVEGRTFTPPMTRLSAAPAEGALGLAYAKGEVIDEAWVRRQFAHNGLIGRPVSPSALVDLVQLINAALIRDGYINSGLLVTPQDALKDGDTLRLELIFGRLGSRDGKLSGLAVSWGEKGNKGLNDRFVAANIPSLRTAPVNAAEIEHDFRLLADHPAIRSVNAQLKPGAIPGEAQLVLQIEPEPRTDVFVSAANSRSPSVGGERFSAGGAFRNLLTGGDQIRGEYGRTSGLSDAVAGYSAPLTPKIGVSIRGGFNNAAVVDRPLLDLDIRSKDRFGEAGLTYTIAARALTPETESKRWISARTLTAGLTFLHRRTLSFLLGERFSFSPGAVNGRAEYSALRAAFDFVDRSPRQALAASVTGSLGLGGTRSDVPGLQQPSRNFRTLLAQVNYARRLTPGRLEVRARLAGQWTDGVLYSAERLPVGGADSVRGYRESLFLVDRGLVGSVELAQPFSLSGSRHREGRPDFGAFTVSVFADGALMDNARVQDPVRKRIASAGASLAWTPLDAVFARVTYGKALTDAPFIGNRDLQDRGVQFLVTVRPLEFLR